MSSGDIHREYSAGARRRARLRAAQAHKRRPAFVHTFFGTRRRTLTTLVALFIIPIVVVQLCYSTTSLLPNVTVGSVQLGGMKKTEASNKLDTAYEKTKVPLYLADSNEVAVEPTLANLGFTVKNAERVDAYGYPFLARLVPYSLFWYQAVMAKGQPEVSQDEAALDAYITKRFGENCEFEPVDGTIAYIDGELQVVDAARGGSCDPAELSLKLKAVTAQLDQPKITLKGTSVAATISTETAQKEYDRLVKQLGDGVKLQVEGKTELIDKDVVASWIQYSTQGGTLSLGLVSETATGWLSNKYGKTYNTDAGVTVVTIKDYAESSRDTGKSGQSLNTHDTMAAIVKDLKGEQDTAKLVVDSIEPALKYTRTYSESDAALSTVMKKYATSHAGTYGVKMVELSGARRNASYNSTHVFTTASTYKLFVAYSILLRIERGELSWMDASYGSYSVSTCFDRMIEYSDNDCAVWFLLHVSYDGVQADARALGATNTTFSRANGISSTAEDEAFFLSLVYTKQIGLSDASITRLIDAMKGNVYVAGIPTGIPNATVADKVGFLDGLLHDAAIVYSSKGDYVLIIMTDNASWANIAELASAIEQAR